MVCSCVQRLELQVLELQTALGHKDKQLMEVQHRCMYVPITITSPLNIAFFVLSQERMNLMILLFPELNKGWQSGIWTTVRCYWPRGHRVEASPSFPPAYNGPTSPTPSTRPLRWAYRWAYPKRPWGGATGCSARIAGS